VSVSLLQRNHVCLFLISLMLVPSQNEVHPHKRGQATGTCANFYRTAPAQHWDPSLYSWAESCSITPVAFPGMPCLHLVLLAENECSLPFCPASFPTDWSLTSWTHALQHAICWSFDVAVLTQSGEEFMHSAVRLLIDVLSFVTDDRYVPWGSRRGGKL
jgi:hypothetical protein